MPPKNGRESLWQKLFPVVFSKKLNGIAAVDLDIVPRQPLLGVLAGRRNQRAVWRGIDADVVSEIRRFSE